jgi:small GTP-binding protein
MSLLVVNVGENIEIGNEQTNNRSIVGQTMTLVGDCLYIFGGNSEETIAPKDFDRNVFYCFNLENRTWASITSVSTRITRLFHSSVQYNGSLCVFGGHSVEYLNDIHRFDPRTQSWVEILASGDSPSARKSHSAVVYKDYMVVFGGQDLNGHACRDLFQFDFLTEAWIEIDVRGPMARFHHSCHVDGSQMVVYGGLDDDGNSLNDVWVFDLEGLKWKEITPSGNALITNCKYSSLSWFDQSRLFVFGVYEHEVDSEPSIHFCDLSNKTGGWKKLDTKQLNGYDLHKVHHYMHTSCYFDRKPNRLYLIHCDQINEEHLRNHICTVQFKLPDDVLRVICTFLTTRDIARIVCTSKLGIFASIAKENWIWEKNYSRLMGTHVFVGNREGHGCYYGIIEIYRNVINALCKYPPENGDYQYIGSDAFLMAAKMNLIVNNTPHSPKKCLLQGDESVGKCNLLYSLQGGTYPPQYVPTVFDNWTTSKFYGYGVPKQVELGWWNTSGQEGYSVLRVLSYPDTNVCILMFDVANPDALARVESMWTPEIRHHIPGAPILLLGTKIDLRENHLVVQKLHDLGKTIVSTEEGIAFAKRLKCVTYHEISSFTGKGIQEFETLVMMITSFNGLVGVTLRSHKKGDKKCVLQ